MEAQLPFDAQTMSVAEELNLDATLFAMNGGEDYELLFTISPTDRKKIDKIEGICIIGEIVEKSEGKKLIGRGHGSTNIEAQGWNAYKE
jgi:thiamine-monophosphate kinase